MGSLEKPLHNTQHLRPLCLQRTNKELTFHFAPQGFILAISLRMKCLYIKLHTRNTELLAMPTDTVALSYSRHSFSLCEEMLLQTV